MKQNHTDGNLDKDPVWELLRQSPSLRPGQNFSANVLRAARLEEPAKPWWSRLILPASIGASLAGVAAVVAVALAFNSDPVVTGQGAVVVNAPDSSLADLQESYETEVLRAASEHLGKYSDEELVSMIGF